MKNLFAYFILLASLNISYAQSGIEINNNGQLKLLGHVEKSRLLEAPFNEWYLPNVDTFSIEPNEIVEVKKAIANIDSLEIFFGTWCGDSRKEVPRFLKILELINYENYKLVGLDNAFQNYKQSPFGEEKGHGIHRVPTFIFYKDSLESGRIIEHPVSSLVQDIINIGNANQYEPNYAVVEELKKLITKEGIEYVRDNQNKLVSEWSSMAKSESELNTYAYVMFTSFRLAEAELAFTINCKLFEQAYRPYLSLGTYYLRLGDLKKAKQTFKTGLKKSPDNPELQKQLARL